MCLKKADYFHYFNKNFGSVSAWFFAISAETPKPTEMPISAETETEISVAH